MEYHPDYKIVAQEGWDDIHISTVWTGLDVGIDKPEIFETMIFGLEDAYVWRYSTERQALKGHQKAVAFAKEVSTDVPRSDIGSPSPR